MAESRNYDHTDGTVIGWRVGKHILILAAAGLPQKMATINIVAQIFVVRNELPKVHAHSLLAPLYNR